MLISYLTTGWRTIRRNTGIAIINITGLSVGMAATILIFLWISGELSVNTTFSNYSRIGKIYHHLKFGGDIVTHDGTSYPYGNEIKSQFPDFKQVAVITNTADHLVEQGEIKLVKKGFFADSSFVKMFDVSTGSEHPFRNNRSILLSRSFASVLFGNAALGKTVRVDSRDDFEVAGVYEDFPKSSAFDGIDMIMSMRYYASIDDRSRFSMTNQNDMNFNCYVLLGGRVSFDQASAKIRDFAMKTSGADIKAMQPDGFILPMDRWYLDDDFKDGKPTGSATQRIWMLGTSALLILALALINFINLSTARSAKRAKEIGVRKIMGSLRSQLIRQFVTESLIIVFAAMAASLVLVYLSIPAFNQLIDSNLSFSLTPSLVLILVIFLAVIAGLASLYPAFYLSSLNVVNAIKGTTRPGTAQATFRRSLVVLQFSISSCIIVCTGIVFTQIQYSKDRPVGFDRKGIVYLEIRTPGLLHLDYNTLRNELITSGAAENVAVSDFPTTGAMSADGGFSWEGKDPQTELLVGMNACSHDFAKTNGFIFAEGRDFSRELASDSAAVIINKLAAGLFWPGKNPIGKKVTFGGKQRTVVGMISDQTRSGPYMRNIPHVYYINYQNFHYLTIRLNPALSSHDALMQAGAVVKKLDTASPFDYEFIDESYSKMFSNEEKLGKMAIVFAIISITISCLGMLTLASYAIARRIREIGIRKVLGASVLSIWALLSKELVTLILISFATAFPAAWYFGSQWLQQFDYRTSIPWLLFPIAVATALLAALGTVSLQSISAARLNPVDTLRSE